MPQADEQGREEAETNEVLAHLDEDDRKGKAEIKGDTAGPSATP
jgi:hypothetical protein